jgi:hypothetical protein
MKKLKNIFGLALIFLFNIGFSQVIDWEKSNKADNEQSQFVFDKTLMPQINTYIIGTQHPKSYSEIYILKNENDNLENAKIIKLANLPDKDKFIKIGEGYFSEYSTQIVLMKNIRTNEFYIINKFIFDWSEMNNKTLDYKYFVKHTPKVLSKEDQLLLSSVRSIIASANININNLKSIQKKYSNIYGEFVSYKVSKADVLIYNKNLQELKKKYMRLKEKSVSIDFDTKLTTAEDMTYIAITDWYNNVQEL